MYKFGECRGTVDIGVAIPVYNSGKTVKGVVERLIGHLEGMGVSFQIVLVDDGSRDKSATVIRQLAQADSRIIAVGLKGNSGQQAALVCGLNQLKRCRYIVTMDDDAQHPPDIISPLYRKLLEGYDLVYAIPQRRDRKLSRRVGSAMRDMLFTLFTSKPRGIKVASYRIMSREIADKICAERQSFIYLSASAFRYAPKAANIPYVQRDREHGSSGYTARSLVKLFSKIFLYYTALGSIFVSKKYAPPYEVGWIQ